MNKDDDKLPFAWCTDIHLDHVDAVGLAAFTSRIQGVKAPWLVVTGDISWAARITRDIKFLIDAQAPHGGKVAMVLGNHDYYRGKIGEVKAAVDAVSNYTDAFFYLETEDEPINLGANQYLIGVDGYADGKAGDLTSSNVWLNDYEYIDNFVGCHSNRGRLARVLEELGKDSARKLQKKLLALPDDTDTVWIATHAPPFAAAHFDPRGNLGDRNWSPHFVNAALGDAITLAALDHPKRRHVVVCGHTHTGAYVKVLPNVTCIVGWAAYRDPQLQRLEYIPDRTLQG